AVTVTAMLREQQLKDVPFSVAAPTAQALITRGADNIETVAANVAGFSVQNLGPGQSQPAIRGASSGQIARDQPGVKEDVGAYLDEAPVSLSLFTPDLDLFDISRVEVLRGPQGTLFGAGSLGGTVRYISNQPELNVNSTFGEAEINAIDGGAPGNNAKLGFNVPLGDKAAFRVAGYSNRLGGWNPIDAVNILANPYTTTRPAVTLGPRQLFTQLEEPFTDKFLLTDLNLKYDLAPGVSLTSITSYVHRDVLVVRDATALTGSVTGGSYGVSENLYTLDAPLDDATTSNVWTQELRLAGGSGRLKWLVGGFYGRSKRHYGQSLLVQRFDTAAAAQLGKSPGWSKGTLGARVNELFFSDLHNDLK